MLPSHRLLIAASLAVALASSAVGQGENVPDRLRIMLPGEVPIYFVRVPAGTFVMGSPPTEPGSFDMERPQHEVTVQSFHMGVTEVTVEQYQAFTEATGHEPPDTLRPDQTLRWRNRTWEEQLVHPRWPVSGVSWQDAVDFCLWMTEEFPGTYRLPTEAEWEYACRAGTTTPFSTGNDLALAQANILGNGALNRPTDVAIYPPNPWGLCDMQGNLWEWCQDAFLDTYDGAPTDGSARRNPWPNRLVSYRVVRGGSWYTGPPACRSAFRHWADPEMIYLGEVDHDAYRTYGFRVALSFEEDAQTLPEDWADGRVPSPIDPPLFIDDTAGLAEEVTNALDMRLRLIPAGSFAMGRVSPGDHGDDDSPPHEVNVGAFYMGVHEVTVAQYGQFLEATGHQSPGDFRERDAWGMMIQHPNHPVLYLTWDDAMAFCEWLSDIEPGTYRLPSDAQWEYAYRAGTTGRFYTDGWPTSEQANIDNRPDGRWDMSEGPIDVGSLEPNPWGLHDMIGNASEWCWDCYHWGYEGAPTDGTPWLDPPTTSRITRGGSFGASAGIGAAHCRIENVPQFSCAGFRVTWVPMEASEDAALLE